MGPKNLPDFLIVGAGKAGTTSLYTYIAKNKRIKMSIPKEPKYFSYLANKTQFNGYGDKDAENNIIKSFEDYTNLFLTSDDNIVKGEASVDYLYYFEDVIPVLKKHLDDPKIIILLRNPVDRAFSSYTHLIRDNREHLSFEESLKIENERIKKGYEFIWHYQNVGLYYDQVKAYLENFSHVKIFLFEDLEKDAQKVVDETCSFLGVPSVTINSTKVYNKSGIPDNNWKTKLYRRLALSKNFLRRAVKMLPLSIRMKIGEELKERLINNNLVKPYMKAETRQFLKNYYKNDILKLQELIHRDLSIWLK